MHKKTRRKIIKKQYKLQTQKIEKKDTQQQSKTK